MNETGDSLKTLNMIAIATTILLLSSLLACLDQPSRDSVVSASSEVTSDVTSLCNINPDTCPGYPVHLRDDTDAAARLFVHQNYPDVTYMPDGTHCSFGPAVSSCSIHIHLTAGLAVNFACAKLNSGGPLNCDFDIVAE